MSGKTFNLYYKRLSIGIVYVYKIQKRIGIEILFVSKKWKKNLIDTAIYVHVSMYEERKVQRSIFFGETKYIDICSKS